MEIALVIAVITLALLFFSLHIILNNPYSYRSSFWLMFGVGLMAYVVYLVLERTVPPSNSTMFRIMALVLVNLLNCFVVFNSQVKYARLNPALVNTVVLLNGFTLILVMVQLVQYFRNEPSNLVLDLQKLTQNALKATSSQGSQGSPAAAVLGSPTPTPPTPPPTPKLQPPNLNLRPVQVQQPQGVPQGWVPAGYANPPPQYPQYPQYPYSPQPPPPPPQQPYVPPQATVAVEDHEVQDMQWADEIVFEDDPAAAAAEEVIVEDYEQPPYYNDYDEHDPSAEEFEHEYDNAYEYEYEDA